MGVRCEGVKGATAKPPCRVRRREILHKHADMLCKCAQLNREKGSREELPCRVQGQRPCWGQGTKPLGSPLQLRAVLNRRNHVDTALVTAALEFGAQPVGRNHLR